MGVPPAKTRSLCRYTVLQNRFFLSGYSLHRMPETFLTSGTPPSPTVVTHRKTVYNAPEWPFADADVAKMTRLDDVLARSECAKTTNIAGDVFPEQLL